MKYKTKIAYDFDGVLCNSMPAFHQYWQEKYNYRMSDYKHNSFEMPMPKDYNMSNIYSDIVESINLYQTYLWPHTFAMEMMREFAREYNEQPIIITARSRKTTEVTDAWLRHYLGIPFTLVHVGGHSGKADIVGPEYGVQYYVEDRFRTVNQLAKTEVKTFMPERPWNYGRPLPDNVVIVNNLLDVWDWIQQNEE